MLFSGLKLLNITDWHENLDLGSIDRSLLSLLSTGGSISLLMEESDPTLQVTMKLLLQSEFEDFNP